MVYHFISLLFFALSPLMVDTAYAQFPGAAPAIDSSGSQWGRNQQPQPDRLPFELSHPTPSCSSDSGPVCGIPPVPRCPSSELNCPMVMPSPRTYSSMCQLQESGANFVYSGRCSNDREQEQKRRPKREDKQVSCPAVYQPVCGQPPMPECPEGLSCPQVMPKPKTYGNSCELGLAKATFVSEGSCKEDQKRDELNCPAVYEPVCGQPPMPECPQGLSCPQVMPQPKTYGNRCELGLSGGIFISSGACDSDPRQRDDLNCPAVYDPVCGQPPMRDCPPGVDCPQVMPQPRTFGNSCELGLAKANFISAGECKDDEINNGGKHPREAPVVRPGGRGGRSM